ncbi:MAG: hypothetical protein H0U74_24020 [Bradymonadaceae bacterium]|nr:hypothetical protein [Lujinxingiaceae bacterium]
MAALLASLGGVLLPAASAQAQAQSKPRSSNEVVLKLLIPRPEGANAEIRRLKHTEMARMASERIERRLSHAGVKDFRVEVEPHGILRVTAHSSMDSDTIAGIVIPRGQMELRPLVATGSDWTSIADAIPSDIELRQDIDSLDAQNAYLWSNRREVLESFVNRISLGEAQVFVYPDEGGWRSLTLGPSLANHNDLQQVHRKTTPSGVPFVLLELRDDVAHRMRQSLQISESSHLAVVLDGEIVATLRFSAERISSHLELSCPPHLRNSRAQNTWVTQVAGRLAAPIPIVLAELKE